MDYQNDICLLIYIYRERERIYIYTYHCFNHTDDKKITETYSPWIGKKIYDF